MDRSYWDVLPLELQTYILKLRTDMYRDDHRRFFHHVLNDLLIVGEIKSCGFFHVKIQVPSTASLLSSDLVLSDSQWPSWRVHGYRHVHEGNVCPQYGRVQRPVSGYAFDFEGVPCEIYIAECLCAVTRRCLKRISKVTERIGAARPALRLGDQYRIPLFWDEWQNPDLACDWFRLEDLEIAREAVAKRRKVTNQENEVLFSYWDMLPLEVANYILKLRNDMYRDDHRVLFKHVLSDLEKIGLIKRHGFVHVKILVPENKPDNFCFIYNLPRRMVKVYFRDSLGITRETNLSPCLCSVNEAEIEKVKRFVNEAPNTYFRLPLFWDEWRNENLRGDYFYPSHLRKARIAVLRSES